MLMHARGPGLPGEEDGSLAALGLGRTPSPAPSLQRTDKGACTHQRL